jgi:peptide chain release factor 1
MIDKLQQVEARFVKVNDLLCLPETVSDQKKYADLMRELKNLTPIVETYREYKAAVENGEAVDVFFEFTLHLDNAYV